jgi:hypothetical protein
MSDHACPRCRRLERILLVVTAYMTAMNWYESEDTIAILDRVKEYLPDRLRGILNRYLAKEERCPREGE